MRVLVWALLLAFGAAAFSVHAQEPPTPTAADVLLLANGSGDAASPILRAALAGSDPAARVAAGRVAAVFARGELAGALVGALARERDAVVGAELVRDVLHLFGTQDLDVVDQQSKRLGAPTQLALAEWMARTQPDKFVERLGQLAGDSEQAAKIARFVSIAAWQHSGQADAIRRAWMAVAPKGTWVEVLRDAYLRTDIDDSDAPLFIDALHSPSAHVRDETVWFVLRALSAKQKVSKKVLAAAAAPVDGASDWEAFGRELIARDGKPVAVVDRGALLKVEGATHTSDVYALVDAPELTAAERTAVEAIVGRRPFVDFEPIVAPARAIASLFPGLMAATLRAANCRADPETVAQATLVYAADGLPKEVSVDPTGLSENCRRAWTVLARTAAADAREPADARPQRLLQPLNDTFVECADAAEAAGPNVHAAVPAGRITQPTKIKDVRPQYPTDAQNRRIQGVVIIQAIIARGGCVAHARLFRSLPYLDAPAMAAVSQWKFTPTLLDGEPVPVIMTVTVNFALR